MRGGILFAALCFCFFAGHCVYASDTLGNVKLRLSYMNHQFDRTLIMNQKFAAAQLVPLAVELEFKDTSVVRESDYL
jgi:glutamine amidotransferase-like uncharacterized protein